MAALLTFPTCKRKAPLSGRQSPTIRRPCPGIIIIKPDACLESASPLEGEQNIHLPNVGSEQYATQPGPRTSSSLSSLLPPVPSPSDTLARDNPLLGEGTATEWRHRPQPQTLETTSRRPAGSRGSAISVGRLTCVPRRH